MFMMESHRDTKKRRNLKIGIGVVVSILMALSAIVFLVLRRRRAQITPVQALPFIPTLQEDISGLTEAQVESRKQEHLDNSISFKPRRSRKDIWRQNIFSVFNARIKSIRIFLKAPIIFSLSLILTGLPAFAN